MSLRKVTSLGSNLASVTDLNELKLHTIYAVISEAITPFQLVGQVAEFKFESKFEATLSPCLSSGNLSDSLRRLFQKVIEGLEGKIIRPSCWGRSPILLARVRLPGRGEHKHRAFPSQRQSLRAATGLLEENRLPLLLY